MTTKELFETLKARFSQVLKQYDIENDTVEVTCRALTPQEAIGETKRKDFPIITGKDVMERGAIQELRKLGLSYRAIARKVNCAHES